MNAQTSTQVLSNLTSPIRRLVVKPDPPAPNKTQPSTSIQKPSPRHPSLPHSWLCHYCVEILGISQAQNELKATTCTGCDHERCGLCDTIYAEPVNANEIQQSISVDAGFIDDGEQMSRLTYYYDLEGGEKIVKDAIAVA